MEVFVWGKVFLVKKEEPLFAIAKSTISERCTVILSANEEQAWLVIKFANSSRRIS